MMTALKARPGNSRRLNQLAFCFGGHAARQLSISRSNAGPPRMGSATGIPSRADSAAISASASASERWPVLRHTPPQRIAGLVRRPSVSVTSIVSSIEGSAYSSCPRISRTARFVAGDEHVRLAAVEQRERDARIGRVKQAIPGPRSRPNDPSAASGLSISAAPAAKSETTASIGMPAPAIMMPVWPVARKSAVDAPLLQGARNRQRGIFLAQRAVRSDGQQPFAAALAPAADRNICRWLTDVDQPASQAFGQLLQAGNIAEAGVHAADDIEACFKCLFERGNPILSDESARIRHTNYKRPSAMLISLARGVLRKSGRNRCVGERILPDAALSGPIAQARTRSWHSQGPSCRRGTGGRAVAAPTPDPAGQAFGSARPPRN